LIQEGIDGSSFQIKNSSYNFSGLFLEIYSGI
jgi:hypothetical protein